MLSWLRLLAVTVALILFIASMWLMPVLLFAVAAFCIKTLWMRIVLVVMGALWWALFRPWLIFRGEPWQAFLQDLLLAFKTLFL